MAGVPALGAALLLGDDEGAIGEEFAELEGGEVALDAVAGLGGPFDGVLEEAARILFVARAKSKCCASSPMDSATRRLPPPSA